MEQTPRWYLAVAKDKKATHKYVYVRKSPEEGSVIVWNGRHFIDVISQDEARNEYYLGNVVDIQYQASKEESFQYYLHY